MFKLVISSSFSAAHYLRGYKGACSKMHGHNWEVRACFGANKLNKIGMVEDFAVLKNALNSILQKIDHTVLNEIEPFIEINPTSENLSSWLFHRLKTSLPNVKVLWVEVAETKNNIARLEP